MRPSVAVAKNLNRSTVRIQAFQSVICPKCHRLAFVPRNRAYRARPRRRPRGYIDGLSVRSTPRSIADIAAKNSYSVQRRKPLHNVKPVGRKLYSDVIRDYAGSDRGHARYGAQPVHELGQVLRGLHLDHHVVGDRPVTEQ
jgi:hypothetical protein